MERLTREDWKNSNSMMWKKVDDLECNDMVKKAMKDVLKKLAEYEDLEQQGKLLKLPCAVGDTAYSFSFEKILTLYVDSFVIYADGIDARLSSKMKESEFLKIDMDIADFGEKWFSTKEEAKDALKELLEAKNSYSQVKVLKSFANEWERVKENG